MASKTRLTVKQLSALLAYNPSTGVLTWKCNRGGSARAGTPAGSLHGTVKRYLRLSAGGRPVYAHVAAYALHHGVWPRGEVDHINGDGLDNRIENLRDVSHAVNMANAKMYRNNTSGLRGVSWHKRVRKWHAQINRGGVRSLGYFDTAEAAHAAYLAARSGHGY